MTIHLFQFRFGSGVLRPSRYLINSWGAFELNLFWTAGSVIEPVGVRDIYALESKAALCKVAITNTSGGHPVVLRVRGSGRLWILGVTAPAGLG